MPVLQNSCLSLFLISASFYTLSASADIYKCKQVNGTIAYSQSPCEAMGAKKINTIDSVKKTPTSSIAATESTQVAQTAISNVPAGVDQPFADPTRPERCHQQQNQIDQSVFVLKSAMLERGKQKAHYDDMQSRLYKAGSGSSEVFNARKIDDDISIRKIADERFRLEGLLQQEAMLHCEVIGVKMQLVEAEKLRYKKVQ